MGLISDSIRATSKQALDLLMASEAEGGLGKTCQLVFEPKKTFCPNCLYDSQNKRSSGRYKAGGSTSFPFGTLCPVCMGKGTLDEPVHQSIVLLCNWNPKTWILLSGMDQSVRLEAPGGRVQTKGKLQDLPAVLQSRRVILQSDLEGVKRYLFELDGEPADIGNIIQGAYFVAMWKRAG